MGLGRTLGGRHRTDGRRTDTSQLLPNLGQMPFTATQKYVLDQRARAVALAPPYIHPNLNFFNQPSDAYSFTVTPNPAPLYPAPGQGPIIVITYTVPRSQVALIRKLCIVHVGGNPPDFTGNVIWRVLKNGGGLQGLSNLTAQYGTFAAPKDVFIFAIENDSIQVSVEVPAGQAAMPAGTSTAASFDGFRYSIAEATLPQQGSY